VAENKWIPSGTLGFEKYKPSRATEVELKPPKITAQAKVMVTELQGAVFK